MLQVREVLTSLRQQSPGSGDHSLKFRVLQHIDFEYRTGEEDADVGANMCTWLRRPQYRKMPIAKKHFEAVLEKFSSEPMCYLYGSGSSEVYHKIATTLIILNLRDYEMADSIIGYFAKCGEMDAMSMFLTIAEKPRQPENDKQDRKDRAAEEARLHTRENPRDRITILPTLGQRPGTTAPVGERFSHPKLLLALFRNLGYEGAKQFHRARWARAKIEVHDILDEKDSFEEEVLDDIATSDFDQVKKMYDKEKNTKDLELEKEELEIVEKIVFAVLKSFALL